jgi:hypothetical protein
MTAQLGEQRLGELRWLVVRGPAAGAFASLGEHLRAEIRQVLATDHLMAPLRRHVAGPPGRERLAAVRQASAAGFPRAWAELAALAEGAAVPLDDLALLNFRGDLGIGPAAGRDGGGHDSAGHDSGGGCSDLAWRGERSFIAHNEDDADYFDGGSAMLTLALDGEPPVTAFWKPGFLPSNAFTVTGTGLAWSIDHLPAAPPGPGAGRHFVARGLQRAAGTIDAAIEYLRGHPSAGGFAYLIGDRAGRIVSVESSAGQVAGREVEPGGPVTWHTNHGRYVSGADASPTATSEPRGQLLAALEVPAGGPDPAWFARALAGAPLPGGVRADPTPADPTATLCTLVVDLSGGEVLVLRPGAAAVTIPLADLAQGRAPARPSG